MRAPAAIAKGTVLRCPSCGRTYETPIGISAAECNKTHASVQMKKVAS